MNLDRKLRVRLYEVERLGGRKKPHLSTGGFRGAHL
jgi:hypothetical protein